MIEKKHVLKRAEMESTYTGQTVFSTVLRVLAYILRVLGVLFFITVLHGLGRSVLLTPLITA